MTETNRVTLTQIGAGLAIIVSTIALFGQFIAPSYRQEGILERLSTIETNIATVPKDVSTLESRVDAIDTRTAEKLTELVDTKASKTRVESLRDSIKADVASLGARIDTATAANRSLLLEASKAQDQFFSVGMTNLGARMDNADLRNRESIVDVAKRMTVLSDRIRPLEISVAKVEELSREIATLERRHEQLSRATLSHTHTQDGAPYFRDAAALPLHEYFVRQK